MTDFRKEDYEVKPITFDECKEWFLYKHYAHRIPSVSYAFGLYATAGGGGKVPIIN